MEAQINQSQVTVFQEERSLGQKIKDFLSRLVDVSAIHVVPYWGLEMLDGQYLEDLSEKEKAQLEASFMYMCCGWDR